MSVSFGEQRTAEQVAVDAVCLARVKRGVALLEERHGPGWVEKVDLDRLDLQSGFECVLGQVFGSFGDGLLRLWGSGPDWPGVATVENCGFYEPGSVMQNARYRRLQAAWEHVLTPQVTRKEEGGQV